MERGEDGETRKWVEGRVGRREGDGVRPTTNTPKK